MTISIINRTFVGISELKLKRLSDGLLYNWPIPDNFSVQDNKEQKRQYTRNAQGRRVPANNYISGEDPVLTISYTHMQPEMIAFRVGNLFEEDTKNVFLNKTLEVTTNNFAGATTSAELGFGISADLTDTTASKVGSNGLSFPLVRAAYATFDPAVADTFAQGANGALKFSNNLVTAKEIISVQMPYTVTGLTIGDNLVGPHSVVATLVDTNNKVAIFYAPVATPNLDGAGFTPGGDAMEIPLFLNNPPGACRSWDLIYTNKEVRCTY